jgi:hypothetical protein
MLSRQGGVPLAEKTGGRLEAVRGGVHFEMDSEDALMESFAHHLIPDRKKIAGKIKNT